MKNLKLRSKLIVSFSCILVMVLVLGALSVTNVNKISELGDNYVNITIPAVEENLNMKYALTSMQKYILDALLTNDSRELKEIATALEQQVANFNDSTTKFLQLAPRFEAEITEIKNILADEEKYRKELMAIASSLSGESEVTAYDTYSDIYEPMISQAEEKLEMLFAGVGSAVEARQASAHQTRDLSVLINIIVLILALICTIVAVLLLTKTIIGPVSEIQNAMKHMDEGDFDRAQVNYVSKDEFGDLANSIRSTISRVTFIIDDLGSRLDLIAEGDFTFENKNTHQYVGVYAPLVMALNKISSDLNSTLGQINLSSDQVASGSEQVSFGAQALAQGATEQASSIEELFSTVNMVSNQIKENAENAQMARTESEKSAVDVENGNRHMQEMIMAMNQINDKSSEISKIIKTIEDIAFQTNILALNAAVEAARAGSAGKGFAVVADEVRNLAGKSAEAAKNTTTLIEETVLAVESGTKIVDSTAEIMINVVEGTEKVTGLVSAIAQASNEQAISITQITQGIEQISCVVQTNSATAEESAAASEELSTQANILKQLVASFNLQDTEVSVNPIIKENHYSSSSSYEENDKY